MKSQQIAERIVACIEQRARYDEQHLRAQIDPSRDAVRGVYPLPVIDPRSVELLGQQRALEREMRELCPPGCDEKPVGILSNHECVWAKERIAFFIPKGDRQVIAVALAATMVEFESQSAFGTVDVALPRAVVAEEDSGDPVRIRNASEVAKPNHRVSFDIVRESESGAWILDSYAVATILSEVSAGRL